MVLLELFLSFLQIGLFSIGGGYAAIPLIEQQAVEKYKWLSQREFLDLITIAEMTPGPITINSATFVGMKVGGLAGALVATLACILPAAVIVSFLAWFYFRYKDQVVLKGVLAGLRPAVVALIAGAGIKIVFLVVFNEVGISGGLTSFKLLSFLIFIGLIFLIKKYELSPVIIMLIGGAIGALYYLVTKTSI